MEYVLIQWPILGQRQIGLSAIAVRSVLPETFEPVRRQFRVPGRVLDIAMPEVMLDGSGILAIVGEFVARRMAQHVRVDGKLNAGVLAGPGHDFSDRIRCERRFAFTDE